jgi:hypothetical protein
MTISEINTLTRFLTNTSSTSLTDANLLILANKYYEEVVGTILRETAGGKSPFGDFNYTAFPTFTINMVSGTQSYNLTGWGTSDDSTALIIMGLEVKDNNGDWHPLKRITFDYVENNGGQSEYQSDNGLPNEYELRDNLIVLYPAPSSTYVTVTAGLKLFFLRTADKFTSAEVTTGTKQPGFPSPFHDMLAYGMAYDYALSKNIPTANALYSQYQRKMNELLKFIGNRDQDTHYSITPIRRCFR